MARSNIRRKRALNRRAAKRPARKGVKKGGISSDKGQYATIKESRQFADVFGNTGYNFNFNLSQFRRASALAPNFKWYKAVSVEWIVEPLFNTFQDSATGSSIPYMLQTMNRTQDTTAVNGSDLLAMGAKPVKLTSRKSIKYTPNWCSPGLGNFTVNGATGDLVRTTDQGLKAQYAYLASPDASGWPLDNTPSFITPAEPIGSGGSGMTSINTNQAIYNGHTVYFLQSVDAVPDVSLARITCNVTWAFKDPHYTASGPEYQNVVPK